MKKHLRNSVSTSTLSSSSDYFMALSSDSPSTKLQEIARRLFKKDFKTAPDFTLFYSDDELQACVSGAATDWWYRYCCYKTQQKHRVNAPRITSFEFQEKIPATSDTPDKWPSARLQVSRTGNGWGWSITVRWTAPDKFVEQPKSPPLEAVVKRRQESLDETKWAPSKHYEVGNPERGDSQLVLFSLYDLVEYLYTLIMPKDGHSHGLILITGSTNSAKSECARGLGWRRLDALKHETRRLHLVSYEDPIEKQFALEKTHGFIPFDVTQRGARVDCKDLDEALKAALRQTPDVFYIGEIREEQDLRSAVEFGGTGHLIIATAHAGSLVEAITKLLRACEKEQLGSRAIYVPKMLGVVHTTRLAIQIDGNGRTVNALVPNLYRRTSAGMQDLIADGIASILPHFPDSDDGEGFGSLGRQFAARWLLGRSKFPWPREEHADAAKSKLLHAALKEDLNA